LKVIECEDAADAVKKIGETMIGWETIANQRAQKSLLTDKIVIAKAVKDWVKPYSNIGSIIPIVIFSTHPEYVVGTRLDYGFHSLLYEQGYSLLVIGNDSL